MPPALAHHGRLLPTHFDLRPGEATLGSLHHSQGIWIADISVNGRDGQRSRHKLCASHLETAFLCLHANDSLV